MSNLKDEESVATSSNIRVVTTTEYFVKFGSHDGELHLVEDDKDARLTKLHLGGHLVAILSIEDMKDAIEALTLRLAEAKKHE